MTNKIVKQLLDYILYKNQIPKRFSVMIRSKHAWKVDLQSFWSKMTICLDKNGPKMGKIDFSKNFHWAILVIYHKWSFYKRNWQNHMTGFWEIGQNGRFWAKMGYFWQLLPQNGENRIFWKNPKMSLPYAYYAVTLCKKPEQTYEWFLRSSSDERTHERTHRRTDER